MEVGFRTSETINRFHFQFRSKSCRVRWPRLTEPCCQALISYSGWLPVRYMGLLRAHYQTVHYITVNEDLSSWTSVDMVAQISKNKLESDGTAEYFRVYVEGECLELLHISCSMERRLLSEQV